MDLSPTLFGVFIDRLYFCVKAQLPGLGVESELYQSCSDDQCPPLYQHADDFHLAICNPGKLDAMLSVVGVFCYAAGMQVNTCQGKTEVDVFCNKRTVLPQRQLCIAGKPIVQVQQLVQVYVVCLWGHGSMSTRGSRQTSRGVKVQWKTA